jgi:predicted phosphoribosyltransferase
LPGHTPVSVEGKVAIVVDDGIATGLTMSAAVADLRKQNPEELVAAVPCAPRDALDDLTELADEIVVLSNPDEYLGSVGAYYDLFPQLTDDDVLELLDEVA